MAERVIKINIIWLIFLIVAVGALIFVVRKNRKTPPQTQTIVRDEFIDKLVETATEPYPLVVTGRKYYEQGELQRARKLFQKAAELDRQYRDAFYHLGIAELALGNDDRAYYALLRAKTIDPIYKPALETLSSIYEERGEATRAAELKSVVDKL